MRIGRVFTITESKCIFCLISNTILHFQCCTALNSWPRAILHFKCDLYLFLYSISLECSTVMWLLTHWNSTLFPSGLPAESYLMISDLQRCHSR